MFWNGNSKKFYTKNFSIGRFFVRGVCSGGVKVVRWVKREENGFCLNVIHCMQQPCGHAKKAWWGYGGVARNWLLMARRVAGKFLRVGKTKRDTMGETMLE
jgi:hypothetical protein